MLQASGLHAKTLCKYRLEHAISSAIAFTAAYFYNTVCKPYNKLALHAMTKTMLKVNLFFTQVFSYKLNCLIRANKSYARVCVYGCGFVFYLNKLMINESLFNKQTHYVLMLFLYILECILITLSS